MKRPLIFLSALLSLALPATAQTDAEFSEIDCSLGTLVWHNPAGATFTLLNTGSTPLIITDVIPDCGCTAVEWTLSPIAPGEKGSISVRYDAEQLGHFSKGIAVYTNRDDAPTYLAVTGKVVDEAAPQDVNYDFTIGALGISVDQVEFDDVHRGDAPFRIIEIVNRSDTEVRPNLLHLPRYLTASYAPEILYPGRAGRILLTLRSELLPDMGLTQTSVYLSSKEGERISPESEIGISAILLPEAADTTKLNVGAPIAHLDKTHLDLGSLTGRSKVKGQLMLTNLGKSPLTVRALQVYNPGISVSISSKVVKPNQAVKMKITATPAALTSTGRRRILLITDDPAQPKTIIDVDVRT